MKKIFGVVLSFLMLNASLSMAQDRPGRSNQPVSKTAAPENAQATPNARTKMPQDRPDRVSNKRISQPTASENAQATPNARVKKDGTPDMRYSENKNSKADVAPAAGPVKKDGTPDMRHKANKMAEPGNEANKAAPRQK